MIKKTELTKLLNFIDEKCNLLGLGDWSFKITYDENLDSIASITMNRWEKESEIFVSPTFKDYDITQKKSVILHELIHGRLDLYKQAVDYAMEKIEYMHEEDFVNDMVRFFEGENE